MPACRYTCSRACRRNHSAWQPSATDCLHSFAGAKRDYVRVCVYIYIYVYICIYIYIHTHTTDCVHSFAGATCMHVCMYLRIMFVCVCNIHTYIYIYIYIYIYATDCVLRFAGAKCMHVFMFLQIVRACVYICMHNRLCSQIHTYSYTYIHHGRAAPWHRMERRAIHTHSYTYIHTHTPQTMEERHPGIKWKDVPIYMPYIHTYIHTYIRQTMEERHPGIKWKDVPTARKEAQEKKQKLMVFHVGQCLMTLSERGNPMGPYSEGIIQRKSARQLRKWLMRNGKKTERDLKRYKTYNKGEVLYYSDLLGTQVKWSNGDTAYHKTGKDGFYELLFFKEEQDEEIKPGMYEDGSRMHYGGSSMLALQTFLKFFLKRFCAFLWYWIAFFSYIVVLYVLVYTITFFAVTNLLEESMYPPKGRLYNAQPGTGVNLHIYCKVRTDYALCACVCVCVRARVLCVCSCVCVCIYIYIYIYIYTSVWYIHTCTQCIAWNWSESAYIPQGTDYALCLCVRVSVEKFGIYTHARNAQHATGVHLHMYYIYTICVCVYVCGRQAPTISWYYICSKNIEKSFQTRNLCNYTRMRLTLLYLQQGYTAAINLHKKPALMFMSYAHTCTRMRLTLLNMQQM